MTATEKVIEVRALAKSYGAIRALDGVTFDVRRGEVLGFLGPNGAGKSTTMRMITGFIPPTAGTVSVCGFDIVDHIYRSSGMITTIVFIDDLQYGIRAELNEVLDHRVSPFGWFSRESRTTSAGLT